MLDYTPPWGSVYPNFEEEVMGYLQGHAYHKTGLEMSRTTRLCCKLRFCKVIITTLCMHRTGSCITVVQVLDQARD